MKRNIITVTPAPKGWELCFAWADGKRTIVGPWKSKAEAVRCGLNWARGHEPSRLRVKGRNGRIQTEHTYPQSSDPRRFKGRHP